MIKPAIGWLYVEPEKDPTVTKGGIALPETTKKEGLIKGKVLAACRQYLVHGLVHECPYKTGDIVYYPQYNGSKPDREVKAVMIQVAEVQATEISDNQFR